MSSDPSGTPGTRNRAGTRAFVFSFAGIGLFLLIGAFLGLRGDAGRALFGNAGFVKSITDDHGTYYRLKVKLTYKGEPQDFDIVVGCNVHIIEYQDNSETYEVGLMPTVFGQRMSDGKALVVRPPNACRGETTANGQVQPDLLPLVIVYDNADALDFGIAYLSEDAYASPLSVLTFGGATIEKSTRAEFDEFRRTQANAVMRASYWTALAGTDVLKRMRIALAEKPMAHICEAYARFRIPEGAREIVQKYWPSDHPSFWIADSYEIEGELRAAMLALDHTHPQHFQIESDLPGDAPHPTLAFAPRPYESADRGLTTRDGGGLVSAYRDFAARSYYPTASDYRLDQWPADRRHWPAYVMERNAFASVNIDFDDGRYRGFGYCYAFTDGRTESADSDRAEATKIVVGFVDRQPISSRRATRQLNRYDLIFDHDNYVFQFFSIYLESTRGDV